MLLKFSNVRDLDIVTLVRAAQFWKAELPIVVAAGMLTLVRAVQFWKASSPIVVAARALTLVRALQPWKASSPIVVIVPGSVIAPLAAWPRTSVLP